MSWLDQLVDRLADGPICGYGPQLAAATEPTALAALALVAAGRPEPAAVALKWLAEVQSPNGSLGVDAATRQPCWPTGWAILAWQAAAERGVGSSMSAAERAMAWALSVRGRELDENGFFGHDPKLHGWPWVEATHSWVEPTAIQLLALRRSGRGEDPRCREAVALLINRALPSGGWNYGNTTVLGNTLRPHVQPTGLALAALASEPRAAACVARSISNLDQALSDRTTPASLCYALMGMAAHGHRPAAAENWLQAACARVMRRGPSGYKMSLLILAAAGQGHPGIANLLTTGKTATSG